jgi:pimeloyl-ACP methyl ester carboxylesterase
VPESTPSLVEEPTHFFSDELKLDASFFFPPGGAAPPDRPVVIPCSGFMGLKTIHPERFARVLAPLGYPCFTFDYRGFGRMRIVGGKVVVDEQVRDIVHAISYVAGDPRMRDRRMVLLGWGMGGGLVLEASPIAHNVDGLICVNGLYDAIRVQRAVRGEAGWRRFRAWFEQQQIAAARSGETIEVDPFDIYPLDPVTKTYVDGPLNASPGFGGTVHFSFAESLLGFAPERKIGHLADVPLLIVHGEDNRLHPLGEAESLYAAYPGPKDRFWVPGAGHTEWMYDDHPTFRRVADRITRWLADQFQ